MARWRASRRATVESLPYAVLVKNHEFAIAVLGRSQRRGSLLQN